MTYARIQEGIVTTIGDPPDLLEPNDATANGQWWDLRHHDHSLEEWETEIIGPHGWLPVVTAERPPDTEAVTYDYSVVLIDGVPTEVWTERPWSVEELTAQEAQANTVEMVTESDLSVDKLIAVVSALNAITDMTNAASTRTRSVIKNLARECKTIARQVNREARMTSGRTEDTDTGPVTDV